MIGAFELATNIGSGCAQLDIFKYGNSNANFELISITIRYYTHMSEVISKIMKKIFFINR